MKEKTKIKLFAVAWSVACGLVGFCVASAIVSVTAKVAIKQNAYSEKNIRELMFIHEYSTGNKVNSAIPDGKYWRVHLVTDTDIVTYYLKHKAPFVYEWERVL